MSFKAIKIKNCKIPEENTLLDNFWKDFAQTGHSEMVVKKYEIQERSKIVKVLFFGIISF